MSLLCQIEMTLPGGFAELAYEPSVLKLARSNNGSGFVGWRIGRRASAALGRGSAPARRPTPTIVTSLSGRDGDISIWRTHGIANCRNRGHAPQQNAQGGSDRIDDRNHQPFERHKIGSDKIG